MRLVAPGKPADAPCLAELSVTLTGMSVRRETLERLTPLLRPTGSVRSNHDRGGEEKHIRTGYKEVDARQKLVTERFKPGTRT